jgi:hypothetical protein
MNYGDKPCGCKGSCCVGGDMRKLTPGNYCVLYDSPLYLDFMNGYVPMDEPPGIEEMEYKRWKDAGGKVSDTGSFKNLGSKVAIGGSITMLAQRPIHEFPTTRMARLVAELYEEWKRLQS